MPMLSETSFLSTDENFLTYRPCLAPRRNVRRCLFGRGDEETRRRTDQWLHDRMQEMHVENSLKSAQWHFDFEADAPLPPSKDGAVVGFEWTPCSADAVPPFYSKGATARPKIRNVAALNKTPLKKAETSCKKPLTKTSHVLSLNEEFAATMVETDGPSTMAAISVMAASVTDTTPQKPAGAAEVLAEMAAVVDEGVAQSTSTAASLGQTVDPSARGRPTGPSLRRKQANIDEQTKMTSFYPHRKRSRRSTNGTTTKQIKKGHVVSKMAGQIDLSVHRPGNDAHPLVTALSPISRPTCPAPVIL